MAIKCVCMFILMDVVVERELMSQSIYTFPMKGSYDDHLKWPFRGVVTIQIVNQAGDHNHIEKTTTYNDQTPEEYVGSYIE